jgi:hypothetical protein
VSCELFGLVESARMVAESLLNGECMALSIVCLNSLRLKFWHNPYNSPDLSCIGLELTSVLIMQNLACPFCSPG